MPLHPTPLQLGLRWLRLGQGWGGGREPGLTMLTGAGPGLGRGLALRAAAEGWGCGGRRGWGWGEGEAEGDPSYVPHCLFRAAGAPLPDFTAAVGACARLPTARFG
eukprot:gene15687-biopygen1154